jgi:uncharacterized protein YjbI with pentapeptide repeats
MIRAKFFLIFCILALGCLLATQAEAAKPQLTKQEKYVLQQVVAGEMADLKAKFGEKEENRHLSAGFLEDLLSGAHKVKVHRKGVKINNAIISERLDLRSAEVPFEVELINCDFRDDVDFQDSRFAKNLRLDKCRFDKEAYFLKMTVGKSAYFTGAIFKGKVNFNGINIGESINMDFTKFKSKKNAYFDSSKIGKSAYFMKAEFSGPLKFRRAFVGEELNFGAVHEGTTFQQGVDFTASAIGFHFAMRDTTINGPAKFVGVKVGSDFYLTKTEISGPAKFVGIKVGSDLNLEEAKFLGPAEFTGADIKRDLLAQKTRFLGPGDSRTDPKNDYAAIFPDMKVGHVAYFQKAVFQGEVNFSRFDVGLELKADEAKFESQEKPVNAFGLKVSSIASFQDVVFQGPVDFSGADIGGQFNASGAEFQSRSLTNFRSMKVGELAQFTDARFHGPVSFEGSRIGGKLVAEVKGTVFTGGVFHDKVDLNDAVLSDLTIKGPAGTPKGKIIAERLRISELNLERTVVQLGLTLEHVIIGNLRAWNLKERGHTRLERVVIENQADLRDSRFSQLHISRVTWPTPGKKNVLLGGMRYEFIEIDQKPYPWWQTWGNWFRVRDPLLDLIENSRYDQRNYIRLQEFFERTAQTDLADQVYIAMKRQELWPQHWYGWLNPVFYFKYLFWDLPVGYGRQPLRIFLFALPFILVGAWLFDVRQVKGVTWPLKNKVRLLIGRLVLSLDVFTPSLLNLGLEKTWHQKLSEGGSIYLFFHRMAGRVFLAVFFFGVWSYFK